MDAGMNQIPPIHFFVFFRGLHLPTVKVVMPFDVGSVKSRKKNYLRFEIECEQA